MDGDSEKLESGSSALDTEEAQAAATGEHVPVAQFRRRAPAGQAFVVERRKLGSFDLAVSDRAPEVDALLSDHVLTRAVHADPKRIAPLRRAIDANDIRFVQDRAPVPEIDHCGH